MTGLLRIVANLNISTTTTPNRTLQLAL